MLGTIWESFVMKSLIARFRRARMKAAVAIAEHARKDGDTKAAQTWDARAQRWSPKEEQPEPTPAYQNLPRANR